MIKLVKEFHAGLIFLALFAITTLSGCLSRPMHDETTVDLKFLNTACINGVKYIRNYVSGGVVFTPLFTPDGVQECGGGGDGDL